MIVIIVVPEADIAQVPEPDVKVATHTRFDKPEGAALKVTLRAPVFIKSTPVEGLKVNNTFYSFVSLIILSKPEVVQPVAKTVFGIVGCFA